MPPFANRVFCAIDTTEKHRAIELAGAVKGSVGGLKIGMETYYALGHDGYAEIAAMDLPIFLDLKLHDIPNTVAGGIRALLPLSPAIINVHVSGGLAMMRAARKAAQEAGAQRPRIIGVTVMTSLDDTDLSLMGVARGARDQAVHLAKLAAEAGLDGVVCSPHEIALIKAACGSEFLTIVPGIRLKNAVQDDQKRIMTPQDAAAAGADVLVIGRPITAAAHPASVAADIARSLASMAA